MRSSYYSDRRFKRSSLAHELCSKIEVTPGPGSRSYRELPSNPSLSLSLSPPLLPCEHSTGPPLVAPTRSSVPPPPPLSLLLFRRYIFCSHRERSVVRATSNGLPHLSLFRLPSKRCPPLPSPLVPLRPESLSSGIRRL